jgi:hypothetical protein
MPTINRIDMLRILVLFSLLMAAGRMASFLAGLN